MQRDPEYAMRMMNDDRHMFMQEEYELKDWKSWQEFRTYILITCGVINHLHSRIRENN